MTLPARSLVRPGTRELVQSLEAFVARSNRLRAAAEAQAVLDGLERELHQRRRHEEATRATARQLRSDLERAVAEWGQLETQRREAGGRPSPPPRTLPLIDGARQGRRGGSIAYEQLLDAQGELTQRIGVRRQQLRRADRSAEEARQAVVGQAEDVERQRQGLTLLREELKRAPSETEVAAGLAAAVGGSGEGPTPSAFALADIPDLDLYRRAALTCPGLSWTVLAAIGSVESSHGRSRLPGVHSGANSVGATGPMQFLAETWAAYGVDGDGDGVADVYQPADAVFGAAKYLCASGAGDPSPWPRPSGPTTTPTGTWRPSSPGPPPTGWRRSRPPAADGRALVDHPNVALSDEARADLLSGTADPRLVAVLAAAAAEHRIAVSVIKTGHAQFVRGTDRVSNH